MNDIELVCIPKEEAVQKTLLPDKAAYLYDVNAIHKKLDQIAEQYEKLGFKYVRFKYKGEWVDLFISTKANFGMNYLIRTGPAEFNKNFLTVMNRKGYSSEGSIIFKKNTERRYPTQEETDIFKIVGIPWIDPVDRDDRTEALLKHGQNVDPGFFL